MRVWIQLKLWGQIEYVEPSAPISHSATWLGMVYLNDPPMGILSAPLIRDQFFARISDYSDLFRNHHQKTIPISTSVFLSFRSRKPSIVDHEVLFGWLRPPPSCLFVLRRAGLSLCQRSPTIRKPCYLRRSRSVCLVYIDSSV